MARVITEAPVKQAAVQLIAELVQDEEASTVFIYDIIIYISIHIVLYG